MKDFKDTIIELLEAIVTRLGGNKGVNRAVKMRAETITENCRLNETKYCGFLAINTGTTAVKVYGVELLPGEGLSSADIVHLEPGDTWTEPIDIEVTGGGSIRMLRPLETNK